MIRGLRNARADRVSELRSLLSGGDRRSIAHSARASRIVHKDPSRVAELAVLAVLAVDDDWLISMRALDSLAKFAVRNKRLRPVVERGLKDFEASQSRALITRAHQFRARLRELE